MPTMNDLITYVRDQTNQARAQGKETLRITYMDIMNHFGISEEEAQQCLLDYAMFLCAPVAKVA